MSDKTKWKLIIVVITIILIFVISIIFSLINIGNDKIYSNIKIKGVKVSGMTQEQAEETVEKKYEEKKANQIKLTHEDYETVISFDQLNTNFDIDKAVQEAYSVGRTGNIITNNYAILLRPMMSKNIGIDMQIDEEALNEIINDVESKLPDVKKEHTYYIEDENLIIKSGTPGVMIEREELKELIKNKINDFDDTDPKIRIPVSNKRPKPIDIEKIIEEISKEPQDAYISQNPTKIHIEEKGVELAISLDEIIDMLKEDEEEYIIPLKITEPSVTVSSLGEVAFTDKLSRFTTNYDASNVNRNNNLQIAANKINGTIINPGEEFSYNKTVGERTISAGFKEANAYAGGEIVLDVGGGICQLSSTLYNATLLANLGITERHNHYFQTSYVSAGLDATVSWGSLDFKFKNNRNFPIKIEATAKDGVVEVSIYGVKEEDDCTVIIDSKVTNIIERKTIYKNDYNLAKGTEEIERQGVDGVTSETYKTVIRNGIIISKEIISKDTYNPLSKVVKRNQ